MTLETSSRCPGRWVSSSRTTSARAFILEVLEQHAAKHYGNGCARRVPPSSADPHLLGRDAIADDADAGAGRHHLPWMKPQANPVTRILDGPRDALERAAIIVEQQHVIM